jgi:hypothetical protein
MHWITSKCYFFGFLPCNLTKIFIITLHLLFHCVMIFVLFKNKGGWLVIGEPLGLKHVSINTTNTAVSTVYTYVVIGNCYTNQNVVVCLFVCLLACLFAGCYKIYYFVISIHVQFILCDYHFVLWPTNAQLFHTLSHSCMFRHYRVILRQLVINTLSSYTSISNAAVGNTIYSYNVSHRFYAGSHILVVET